MTPEEKQLADQLLGKEQQPAGGVLGAAREAVQELFPGLSAEKFAKDVGHELAQQVAFGAHELAAAIFNGNQVVSPFVMYPGNARDSREDHGVHGPEQSQGEHSFAEELEQQRQQERGGREM